MADVEEACFTGLCLGLGLDTYNNYHNADEKPKMEEGVPKSNSKERDNSYMVSHGLSFSVCSEDDEDQHEEDDQDRMAIDRVKRPTGVKNSKICGSNGVISNSLDGNNPDWCRKKLRLTKEQSTFLEESFKLHRTLAPAQKQALADQLNLKPRQVEVWFQNRRARSKLKQIEIDFERLKKKCESLSDRNQRLEKELHDLRSVKDERSSICTTVQHPGSSPTSLLLCSSCQKIVGAGERN